MSDMHIMPDPIWEVRPSPQSRQDEHDYWRRVYAGQFAAAIIGGDLYRTMSTEAVNIDALNQADTLLAELEKPCDPK